MKRRKSIRKAWEPLVGGPPAPEYLETLEAAMKRVMTPDKIVLPSEVWLNDTYQVIVRYAERDHGRQGILHLSIHRHDRRAMRDWRHLQQIKNEVAGEERTAYELFPPESLLVDSSNEYHLWVLAAGAGVPMMLAGRQLIFDHTFGTAGRVAGEDKARQRPFQPGLTPRELTA